MISIGEFSKITTVTTNTLRYYDEIGLLKPVFVNQENGYRYYDITQLKTMLLINKLKQYRFSLDEIVKLIQPPLDNQHLLILIQQKQYDIQQNIAQYASILQQINQDIHYLKNGGNIMSYLDNISVQLIDFKTINIFSLRLEMNLNEFGQNMAKLYQTVLDKKLTVVGAPMTFYHDREFNPAAFDAEIAIPVKESVAGTHQFDRRTCAMAKLIGPYSALSSVYTKIMQWIDTQGYKISSAPFEIYLTDPNKTEDNQNITEVYFPIVKQTN